MLKELSKNLGTEAYTYLEQIGKDAVDAFTPEEKESLKNFVIFVAELRLRELSGENIGRATDVVDATIKQWKVAGKTALVSAFKQTAREVMGLGGEFLGGLLRGALAKV